MSQRYKGAVISATPPTTTGGNSGTAPGIWTLQQQMQAQNGGVWPPQPVYYIEDVFSTWLFTGAGTSYTVNNGINLSSNGGMTWIKPRNASPTDNLLYDTSRGAENALISNDTIGQYADSTLNSFTSTGFTGSFAASGRTFASWTFAKIPKFFDVVTYTGNGVTGRSISHNLKSVPGCIIVKKLDSATANWSWAVWHRSIASIYGANKIMELNTTNSVDDIGGTGAFNSQLPISTEFYVGNNIYTNLSGSNYVAYLFAHDAGGFGLTGTDNVISCGSFTVSSGTGSTDVNLGFEPQWLLVKPSSNPGFATNWNIYDNMRSWVNTTDAGNVNARLSPNTTNAETADKQFQPTATGFTMLNSNVYPGVSITYIYIAIRRGPMKTPTSATGLFSALTRTGTGSDVTINASLNPVDLTFIRNTDASLGFSYAVNDRLRGVLKNLYTERTQAETGNTGTFTNWAVQTGYSLGADTSGFGYNYGGAPFVNLHFKRAPSFMDVVCYKGTGTARTINHNLTVAPELIILKGRNAPGFVQEWYTYAAPLGNTKYLVLQATDAQTTDTSIWQSTNPTASVFSIGSYGGFNNSNGNYVAYLFASCPGVSKIGSYTGNASGQTINCGFAARFVMIKRTDSTGDWWTWNTASGMVAGNDKRNPVNTSDAQINTNWVYTNASGFQIVTGDATVNASGGSYIYLAIA